MTYSICVCGSGTMGSGIAQLAAQSGFRTILYDINKALLAKAKSGIEKNLESLVGKNKISPSGKASAIDKLYFTDNIQECRADIVIEAIIEHMETKTQLFRQLSVINDAWTVFATNTSSLSVNVLAKNVDHPERFIGMHFFNPPQLMKLVEVVKTDSTSEPTIQTITGLAKRLGKIPVICKDAPGFIVNHVARPYYLEALHLIEKGISDQETIDTLMEATGFKMGPFRLMDLIGNDVNYAVTCSVYEALNKPERLKPSPVQEERIQKNELGRKSGKGYYTYR